MLTRTEDEVFGRLEAPDAPAVHQDPHAARRRAAPRRRHLHLRRPHPIDVAMSDRDHGANVREERAVELRVAVVRRARSRARRSVDGPEDPAEYLRWFIDNDEPPTGSGPHGLDDYCQQVRTYWDARDAANVHLFHYADLWADRDGEMRRVAAALGVPIDEERWPAFVEAAGSTRCVRARRSPHRTPTWASGCRPSVLQRGRYARTGPRCSARRRRPFRRADAALCGDAADWMLGGRVGLALSVARGRSTGRAPSR